MRACVERTQNGGCFASLVCCHELSIRFKSMEEFKDQITLWGFIQIPLKNNAVNGMPFFVCLYVT